MSHCVSCKPPLPPPIAPYKTYCKNIRIQNHTQNQNRLIRSFHFDHSSQIKNIQMEIKVESHKPSDQERVPLLTNIPEVDKTLVQKAISQTFESTAHLANLLPTGSVLAFQLLAPIFTNQGECDAVSRAMTAVLVALCGVSCFFLTFTDSFKDAKGNLSYGFATRTGLWIIDGSSLVPPEFAEKYRLKFIDFVHAFMSILVFGSVALFNQDVVNCFYPQPSDQAKEVLTAVPVGIGVMCSMLFIVFPTKRHGIGFPITNA